MNIIIYHGVDTAADWMPEGGADDDAAACPVCGNALEIDADGWYICDHCEMAWQDAPTLLSATRKDMQ